MQNQAKTEIDRLAALRGLKLLDTPPSEAFDRITRLAAAALSGPIALVSLVDESRQWFKSHLGVDMSETPREASICSHVVQSRRPLLVPDTTLDARFSANPLVTGPPHIRAYIGVPVFTRLGHAIGTLCVLDRQPRNFDSGDIDILKDLARIVEDSIHTRELSKSADVAMQFAGERDKLFRDTFELAGVGMVHVSLAGRLMRANQHVCGMLGYEHGGLDQTSVIDLTHPEDIGPATGAFRRLTGGFDETYRIDKRLRRRDGDYLWCRLTVALKQSATGEPEYAIAVIQDTSEIRRAREELRQSQASADARLREQEAKLQACNEVLRAQAKTLLLSDLALHDSEHRMRAIADSVPASIGYWNRELRCEFANEAYRDMFQLEPQRILGMHLKDLLGAARFQSVEARVRAALEGHAQRFEQSMLLGNGSHTPLDIRYVPDRHAGEVRGFFVLVTDPAVASGAIRDYVTP
jgi:PAS domain S-box-containing protein